MSTVLTMGSPRPDQVSPTVSLAGILTPQLLRKASHREKAGPASAREQL